MISLRVRSLEIAGLAAGIGILVAFVAQGLVMMINVVTNLAFYGRWSVLPESPWHNDLGPWVCVIPVIGGLIVGVMARYGSKAIRGHGIPEAMEQILENHSRISPRVALFKPLSAAISIGTGGPFGAEGPIIATGGAFGSAVGQLLSMTVVERKVLLAAGAVAGMSAIFRSPVAAVLLAIELLLFELRARSIIPVAIACVAAMLIRSWWGKLGPFSPCPPYRWHLLRRWCFTSSSERSWVCSQWA